VVVGGGNAALCAALSARETGASVALFERAPRGERGGNSHFTGGGGRFTHSGAADIAATFPGLADELDEVEIYPYSAEDFFADMARVTRDRCDPDLTELLVTQSRAGFEWAAKKTGLTYVWNRGVGAHKVDGKYKFRKGAGTVLASGEGAGLVEGLFAAAERDGVAIAYDSRVTELVLTGRTVTGVKVVTDEGTRVVEAGAVVLACGGFEANDEWRTRYLGPNWDLALVRGTRYNTGDGHQMALDIGARPFGHWSGCHATPWDVNAGLVSDRRLGNDLARSSYAPGIMVNEKSKRFVDEGADISNYTYAIYGGEILKQPGLRAYQIFDDKTFKMVRPTYSYKVATHYVADTIEELAAMVDLDPVALRATVDEFNAACRPGTYNPTIKDGLHTTGLAIEKTNWAQPISDGPFHCMIATTGITFTYGGLRINTGAQVLDWQDKPIKGLYAAGEIVGGLFYHNYPSGSGITAGTVFGRIAGRNAGSTAGATAEAR
jgi:tricarballylate dehydrogenase